MKTFSSLSLLQLILASISLKRVLQLRSLPVRCGICSNLFFLVHLGPNRTRRKSWLVYSDEKHPFYPPATQEQLKSQTIFKVGTKWNHLFIFFFKQKERQVIWLQTRSHLRLRWERILSGSLEIQIMSFYCVDVKEALFIYFKKAKSLFKKKRHV